MATSFTSIRSILLLGALWSSVHAELSSNLYKRGEPLSPRQGCRDPSLIPACPGPRPCIQPGGICCSDGFYVMPPNTCADGSEPIATAIVSEEPSETEVATSVVTLPPVLTTLPPNVEYRSYTWTITYTYYWTYYFGAETTSYETSFVTIVSASATAEEEASSIFSSISAELSSEIPTQTVTPTSYGSAPVAPSTPAVTSEAPTYYPTGNYTVPSTSGVFFTGAASSLRAGTVSYFGNMFMMMMGVAVVVPGLLMVWL